MGNPSVSVALATYNGAAHLAQQLADLANQSLLPCELVVCDDGSNDDTLGILRGFADSAGFPVRIHRNSTRLGYRANFMKCAGLCSGDLVAFCDQDDRWSPTKLEIVAAEFRNPDTMLVFHNAGVMSANGVVFSKLRRAGRQARWEPLTAPPWLFALGFTQVFRRSLVRFDNLWPKSVDQNRVGEPLAHDQWYFFLASAIGIIVYLPDILADYRQHGANTYGWQGRASTLLSRTAEETEDPNRAIASRLAAARARADILGELANGADEPLKSRLRQASEKYTEFAHRYLLRMAVYEGRSYRERARALVRLIAAGAYGRDAWRIGALGLAMDCLVGLTRNSRKGKQL